MTGGVSIVCSYYGRKSKVKKKDLKALQLSVYKYDRIRKRSENENGQNSMRFEYLSQYFYGFTNQFIIIIRSNIFKLNL